MGYSRSSSSDWDSYTKSAASASYGSTFTRTSSVVGAKEDPQYNPKNIGVRESRDSDANPDSTPVILALDGTGSMNSVIEACYKQLGIAFQHLLDKKPVSDPHMMAMIFDDVWIGAPHPLQVSQFESDTSVTKQLSELFIDKMGGANESESYHLPLHFAATRTEADAFKKGRKGFLFTFGDEMPPPPLTKQHLQAVYGDDISEGPYTYRELFDMASQNYHVFHVMVEQGSNMRSSRRDQTKKAWNDLIGQHAVPLSDVNALAEVVVGIMQVVAGEDAAKVAADYKSSSKDVAVAHSLGGLTTFGSGSTGVARL